MEPSQTTGPSASGSEGGATGSWGEMQPIDYSLAGGGPVRLGGGSVELQLAPEVQPTAEELQATFRQSERDYRSATEQSVAGSGYVARSGDNISKMLGTSDPQAIGNFMRANGLTGSSIEAGRNYFMPEDSRAYGDASALGQAVLDGDNRRLAALARERFNFGDGMDANDIRLNSFAYKSRLSTELAKVDAQNAYEAGLASAPSMTATNVAAQQARQEQGRALLNYLDGQGRMALVGVASSVAMIGSGDVRVASDVGDLLEPLDNLIAPSGPSNRTLASGPRRGPPTSDGTAIQNLVLGESRVGFGEKGFGSGNKVDQVANRIVLDAEGGRISIGYPVDPGRPYATQEFPGTPRSHGFPDLVDNYAGEATSFTLRNGATLSQLEGSLNGASGRFEWIIDPQLGGVTHRMFVPGGTINGVPVKP